MESNSFLKKRQVKTRAARLNSYIFRAIADSLGGMLQSLKSDFEFLTPRARLFLGASLILGLVSAAVEYAFVGVLQLFLLVVGLTTANVIQLPSWLPTTSHFALLSFIVVGALRATVVVFRIYFSRMCGQHYAQDVRSRIVFYALRLGPRVSTARAIAIFSDIVTRSSQTLLNLCALLTALVTAVAVIIVALTKAPLVVTVGLLLAAFSFLLVRPVLQYYKVNGAHLSANWQHTNLTLTEGMRNFFYIQLCGLAPGEIQRANQSLENYRDGYRNFILGSATRQAIPLMLAAVLIVAMTFLGLELGVAGSILITVLYLFLRCLQNLGETYSAWNDLRVNGKAFREVKDWILEARHMEEQVRSSLVGEGNYPAPETWALDVDNISFGYEGRAIVDGLSVSLRQGDCWYISGESGVGKSTLLSLIMGYLVPSAGDVRISGKTLAQYDKSILDLIGYVGAHPYLIEGTIRENLLYGNVRAHEISDNEILAVLSSLHFDSLIADKSHGLNTRLDELGSNFSTGQKQRLQLARTVLRRPKLLILDEATSSLDEKTEAELLLAMRPVFRNSIVIIVSHRPHLARLATQELKMTRPLLEGIYATASS